MGFFFTKQTKAKRPPSGGRKVLVTKQSAQTLNRLGCAACPLDKVECDTPKMAPTLITGGVYFLAEGPGQHEDEESRKPLTGPSGRLLRSCIPEGEDCSFDNVVNCRPPGNRTPTANEIECCRPRRIKFIEEAKPKVIVGLGIPALQFMLRSANMKAMRGRLYLVTIGNHTCWFLPTYHPSFILRIAYNKAKPLNSKMGHCFRMDIKRAFAAVNQPLRNAEPQGGVRAAIQCFSGRPGTPLAATVCALVSEARKATVKAVDIETSTLRPYGGNPRVLTVAISHGNTDFSFALDHPKAGWSQADKAAIKAELRKLLVDETIKVAHNAPFELEWFIYLFGKDVVRHDVWECTQMQAHFLDERRDGQALDDLCLQHFGLAYKSLFKLDKKNMAAADLDETLIYNGADTKYTLRLWYLQTKLLKTAGLLDAYYDALPRQAAVALMQSIGIPLEQKEVKAAQAKLEGEIQSITGQIEDLKVVRAFKKDRGAFNPLSQPDTLAIFKDYLKIELQAEAKRDREGTESTGYSLAKSVLEEIDHPLAELIVKLRNRNKMKSTYVDSFEAGKGKYVWDDGLIHPNFNTTFTETGRTSSDGPNQQNWPKRADAWVRRQIKAPKGHIILAFDYGQLQACTAAMCSKDPVFVKALWDDYDTHMEWAIKLDKIDPGLTKQHECDMTDPKSAKKYRSLIKNKLVFPAIFGATNESITGYLNANPNTIDDLMDDFWDTFKGLKRWQDNLMKGYWDKGWVTSPVGRKHNYPITRNQAINFPVQAAEAEIVCDAMCRLSESALHTDRWYQHPVMNIHDDLTMIVPEDDQIIEDTIEHTYKIMLTPPYDWINVPLSVECSVGHSWDAMTDIGKFWSHKDL